MLGHEGAGVVEAVGAGVLHLKAGDRVVLSGSSCGVCSSCRDNLPSYCREVIPRSFGGQRMDVYVDGRLIADAPWYVCDLPATPETAFRDTDYEIPAAYTKGKDHITIKLRHGDKELLEIESSDLSGCFRANRGKQAGRE